MRKEKLSIEQIQKLILQGWWVKPIIYKEVSRERLSYRVHSVEVSIAELTTLRSE